MVIKLKAVHQAPPTSMSPPEQVRLLYPALQNIPSCGDLAILFRADTFEGVEFYLLRSGAPALIGNLTKSIMTSLTKLVWFKLDVEWIRPLNRWLQRRLELGDIAAGAEDLDRACREENWFYLRRTSATRIWLWLPITYRLS